MAYPVAHGPMPAVTSRMNGSIYTFKNLLAVPLYKQSHHLTYLLWTPSLVYHKHLVSITHWSDNWGRETMGFNLPFVTSVPGEQGL